MGAKSIRAFFRLIRLDWSLVGASAVLASGFLAGDLTGLQAEYFVASSIVFFSAVGSFALNDYYDFEVDMRNLRYDRPLISESISRNIVFMTGIASFSLVLVLSLSLNMLARFGVLVSLPLSFLYNLGLKRKMIVKNLIIAYGIAAIILFGSIVSNPIIEPLILYLAAIGFVFGFANEVMLDIGDVEGDKASGIETLSTRFGAKKAAQVSTILEGLVTMLGSLPFFVMIDPRLYQDHLFLLIVLIPIVTRNFISKSLLKDQSKNNIFRLKKRAFINIQIGLMAYLIGVLL